MEANQLNLLFLCTSNSARSIVAEAILNQMGGERFRAYSAGSHPRGEVHPMALDCLEKGKIPINGLRSKSWNEFSADDAPYMDFVITVCDKAAGEICPQLHGRPITAHWEFEDPAAVDGSEEERLKAFQIMTFQITNRIAIFLSLLMDKIERLALQEKVRGIGKSAPSDSPQPFLIG